MPAKVPDPIIRHDKQFSFPASIWLTRLRFTSPHTFVSWFLSMSVVVLLMKLVVEVTNHVTCQTGLFGLPYDIWFKAPLYSAPTPWHRTPTFGSVTTSEGTNILSCISRVPLCDQWNLTAISFSSLSPEILRVNQMLFLIQTNVPFSGRKSRIVNGSLSGFFLCALNKQIYHEAPFKMHIDRQIPQQQFIFVHTSFILAWSILAWSTWPKLLVMDTWTSLSLFKAVPSKYSIIVISRKCASYKGYTEFDCLSLASATFRDLYPQIDRKVANSPL